MAHKRVYVSEIIENEERGINKLYKIVHKYDSNFNRIKGGTFYGRFIRKEYKKITTELTFTDGLHTRVVIGHNVFYSIELPEQIKYSITNKLNHIPRLEDLAKRVLYSSDIEILRQNCPGIFI
jgi:hypothetical protein